jgi:hypothetical protein
MEECTSLMQHSSYSTETLGREGTRKKTNKALIVPNQGQSTRFLDGGVNDRKK